MTSCALLLHGQLRKGSCVWSVPDFMNLRHALNANGGDSLELWRHRYEYTEPLRTTDSGCFPSLWGGGGGGGGGADCLYVIKYYEESPKQCGETKPWNNKNIYISLSYLSGKRGHQTLPEIPREYRFNQKHLRSGTKPSTNTFVSYSSHIPRTHPLTLWDRMNFLPQTSPYPTDNLGQMKVPQQIDAEKCN